MRMNARRATKVVAWLRCRGARRSRRRILPQPGWDGTFRAVCFVARLANGACHWLRLASRIPSRKAAVATVRDLFRGSRIPWLDRRANSGSSALWRTRCRGIAAPRARSSQPGSLRAHSRPAAYSCPVAARDMKSSRSPGPASMSPRSTTRRRGGGTRRGPALPLRHQCDARALSSPTLGVATAALRARAASARLGGARRSAYTSFAYCGEHMITRSRHRLRTRARSRPSPFAFGRQ